MRAVSPIVFAVTALLAGPVLATKAPLERQLESRLGSVSFPSGDLGVAVLRVGSGADADQWIFSRGAELPLVPASNLKVVTTAAALDRLGTGFELSTSLRMRGRVEGDALLGDLIVVGRGDPGVSGRFRTAEDGRSVFGEWAAALHARGITRIKGSILLDDTYFDRELIHPTWKAENAGRWYQSPISALPFEDACVGVRVLPSLPGQSPIVELLPPNSYFHIDNQAYTLGRSVRSGGRLVIRRVPGEAKIQVLGKVPARGRGSTTAVPVDDPTVWFGAVFAETLQEEGIVIDGEVRLLLAADGLERGEEIARHATPLTIAASVCNRRSQNLFAETILKVLGAERRGQGSWAAGLAEVDSYFTELGIERSAEEEFVDGSGLSAQNRIKPATMARFLAAVSRRPAAPAFLGSLATPGDMESTFGRRLRRTKNATGNVLVKTGTLAAVRTLCGYVRGDSGAFYAFAFFVNHDGRKLEKVTWLQDRFVEELLRHG